MPRVTVAIPFYNNARTLPVAVKSVLRQSFTDWELLLVDDGSTDGSLAIARQLAGDHVRVVADGQNRGLVARLNQIAELATGSLLARMDADDINHRDRLAHQVAYFDAHPRTDVLCTGAWIVDGQDRVTAQRGLGPLPEAPGAVFQPELLLHPTVMAPTSWFRAHPYDPNYPRAEDKELWARRWGKDTFARVPLPLLYYRVLPEIRVPQYRAGCRSDRALLRNHGPRLVGGAGVIRRCARSHLVEKLTVGAQRLGLGDAVIRVRDRKPSPVILAEGQRSLDDLLAELAAH